MKKTILVIDHDPGLSGASISLKYLLTAFERAGYTVWVQTPKDERLARSAFGPQVNILGYGKWNIRSLALSLHFSDTFSPISVRGIRTLLKELVKFFLGIILVVKAIRETRADLVYVNEYVVIQACLAARLQGIASVTHIRSPLIRGVFGIRRWLASRLIVRANDLIIAITAMEAQQLRTSPEEAQRVHVIGEFVSEPRVNKPSGSSPWKKSDVPPAKNIVAMLGGIDRIKGTLDFLEAARQIRTRRDDVMFVLAGKNDRPDIRDGGAYFSRCMEILQSPEMRGAVMNVGHVGNPLELIASSTMVVCPSVESHFSRPIIEAWGLGKPVVATRTEHHSRVVRDGVNGFLVEVGDPAALARRIEDLLGDVKLRRSMGKAGKKKTFEEFNAEVNTRSIVSLCSSLLEARTSAPRIHEVGSRFTDS